LKQPSSGGIRFPCHPEWIDVFLYKPIFSYAISCSRNFLSRLVRSYVHKIVLQFYVYFCVF
jgi:hypothetical protein